MACDMAGVWSRSGVLLLAIIVAAAAIRLIALVVGPGYPFDVVTFERWAARMATTGPSSFYDPAFFADYPPGILYLLWPLGMWPGGVPDAVVRAIGIPFDLGVVLAAFGLVRRIHGDRAALVAAAAYGLNPAPALAGPFWGQLDAVGILPLVLSLAAAAAGRPVLAGGLATLATLVKPQLAVGLGVLLMARAGAALRSRDMSPLLRTLSGAAAMAALLVVPFAPTPDKVGAIVRDATSTHPFSSLFAFNVWALVAGFAVPDDTVLGGLPLRVWGLILVASGLGLIAWRTAALAVAAAPFADKLATGLAMTTLATLAIYELPTRIHERYLLPAIVLLVPFVVASRRAAAAYVVLSIVLAVSVAFAFTHQEQTGIRAGPLIERTLFDPSVLVLLILTGIAATGALVSLWWRRRPALV